MNKQKLCGECFGEENAYKCYSCQGINFLSDFSNFYIVNLLIYFFYQEYSAILAHKLNVNLF